MSARDRILAAARDLFQRRGFHAVGLTDILIAATAPKGSLYHHFPAGKDELGAEAVRGIAADVTAFMAARRGEGANAATILGEVAEMSARWMEAAHFQSSPLIAAVAHQTTDDTPRLSAALGEAYAAWRGELAAAFTAEGHAPSVARSLARTAVAVVEGAVIIARVDRDAAPLRAVADQIARLAALEHHASLDVAGAPS